MSDPQAIALAILLAILTIALFRLKGPRRGRRPYAQTLPVPWHMDGNKTQLRLQVQHADCEFILRRAYSGQAISRDAMQRAGLPARRWTVATRILKDLGLLPLGQHAEHHTYRILSRKFHGWYKAAKMGAISPY